MTRRRTGVGASVTGGHIHVRRRRLRHSMARRCLLYLLSGTRVSFASSIKAIVRRQVRVIQGLITGKLSGRSSLGLLVVRRRTGTRLRATTHRSCRARLVSLGLLYNVSRAASITLSSVDRPIQLHDSKGSDLFARRCQLSDLGATITLHSFGLRCGPGLSLFVGNNLRINSFSN